METPDKRSPDGRLQEWSYTRLIAHEIVSCLTTAAVPAQLVVPEVTDVPVPERCRRVNEVCRNLGKTNVLLLFIHINAAGKGDRRMKARGWSCYTTRGDTQADALATALYEAARVHLPRMRLRTDYADGDRTWRPGFTFFGIRSVRRCFPRICLWTVWRTAGFCCRRKGGGR